MSFLVTVANLMILIFIFFNRVQRRVGVQPQVRSEHRHLIKHELSLLKLRKIGLKHALKARFSIIKSPNVDHALLSPYEPVAP